MRGSMAHPLRTDRTSSMRSMSNLTAINDNATQRRAMSHFDDDTIMSQTDTTHTCDKSSKSSITPASSTLCSDTEEEPATESLHDLAASFMTAKRLDEFVKDFLSRTTKEQEFMRAYNVEVPYKSGFLRLTSPSGSINAGTPFTNLEFVRPEWKITQISAGIRNGAVSSIAMHYSNGLISVRGGGVVDYEVEICDFRKAERIISATIQTGKASPECFKDYLKFDTQIIGIQFHTNMGRSLIAQAKDCGYDKEDDVHYRDGTAWSAVETRFIESPFPKGDLKGLFGRDDSDGIWRIGFIWGESDHDDKQDTQMLNASLDVIDPVTEARIEVAKLKERIKTLESQIKQQQDKLNQL